VERLQILGRQIRRDGPLRQDRLVIPIREQTRLAGELGVFETPGKVRVARFPLP
jgi:hypothetical protein